MNAVLISIRPKWCDKIVSGDKTFEIRKTAPKIKMPFKCYIYHTSGGREYRDPWCTAVMPPNGKLYNGSQKVIGEFVCDEIIKFNYSYTDGCEIDDDTLVETMLDREEVNIYANGKAIFCWHISDLVIYDSPKELGDFYTTKICPAFGTGCDVSACIFDERCLVPVALTRPPQSWCYVEEIK